jgi:predicted esterase
MDTPQEGPAIVDCVDSAVDYLAAQVHIDRKLVGLIGFSRGAYNVDYVLTNPGTVRIAAAISAEGYTGSYGVMLVNSLRDLQDGKRVGRLYAGGGTFHQVVKTTA